ncbi:MAG: hypothetical protein IT162_20570 [Bryobacterales bacterium]|nr:hypothetical protein [Bryobacterales bacterium]
MGGSITLELVLDSPVGYAAGLASFQFNPKVLELTRLTAGRGVVVTEPDAAKQSGKVSIQISAGEVGAGRQILSLSMRVLAAGPAHINIQTPALATVTGEPIRIEPESILIESTRTGAAHVRPQPRPLMAMGPRP